MDCSKTKVFLAEWERMCDSTFLNNCTLCQLYGRKGDGCSIYVRHYPEEAIKIVQKWSDEHPIKTRLSLLKEQYPNIVLNPNYGIPYDVCAGILYGFENCDGEGNYDCEKCWNMPIKEE